MADKNSSSVTPPSTPSAFPVVFTPLECEEICQLLDVAVRAQGLSAAPIAIKYWQRFAQARKTHSPTRPA